MVRASPTCGFVVLVVWLAILPVSAGAADPGPPPGIPAPPQTSELAQQRADREARGLAEGAVTVDAGTGVDPSRTTAWQRAVDQSEDAQLDEVLEPRPLAAIIGTVWFLLAARASWRSRRRNRHAA